MTVSQSQPCDAEKEPLSPASEPSVSEWMPPPNLAHMGTLQVKAIGSRALKTRRVNPKRGRLGGKRYVAMWRVKGDDTFFIELGAGEHKQVLRLSGDALDAIEELHDCAKGNGQTWKLVYRVLAKAGTADLPAKPREDPNAPLKTPDEPK